MNTFFQKTKIFVATHKVVSIIAAAIIIFGGYKTFTAKTAVASTRYVLGTVQRGLIISTVTGSGQISASDQQDASPKASGTYTWVGVKVGDTVRAGQAIASIDDTTAKQSIGDAENALAAAKLQYQKDQASAPISYQQALDAVTTAQTDLQTEYNNTFNELSTTYLDMPNVVSGLDESLHGFDFSTTKSQANENALANMFTGAALETIQPYERSAESDYQTAKTSYDPAITTFKTINRGSDSATIEANLNTSITTLTSIAQAIQSEITFLGEVNDLATQYAVKLPSILTTMQNNARSYLTTTNSDLSTLLAEKKTLANDKQTIVSDQQNVELLQVGNTSGSNPISLQISQNDIEKQEEDLATLKTNLSNYTVFAPFNGTVTVVNAVVGDSASGVAATIITQQQIAQLSLNEVDAAKVAVGNKATLTFDAINNLSLTGTVAQIDPVGTVSQGVVSYTVKISLDSQDPRIKPGMTVNATIQTQVKPNVLYVPSSAVKTSNGSSYVLAFDPAIDLTATSTESASTTSSTTGTGVSSSATTGVASAVPPEQIPVVTGISDDTNVEIISGLTEGQQIVTRTITTSATTAKTTTTAGATTRGAGGFGGATGGIRIP